MLSRPLSKLLGLGDDRRAVSSRRARSGSRRPGLESLEGRQLLATVFVPGSVFGQGSTLNHQDLFSVNAQAAEVGGVTSDSGTLTFVDKAAGDTFTAASITSIQIVEATPVAGPSVTSGYFIINGTATLNTGTDAAYKFTASGSLPFPANTGSTGGLEFQATGPNGFSYNTPWRPWDPGEKVALTVTQPVLLATTTHLTSSANPSVFEQPVTFTATVAPVGTTTATVGGSVSFAIDSNAPVTEPVVNGKATFSTYRLGVGTHKVVATYLGTSVLATSSDTIGAQVTNQANSTTSLSYYGSFVAGQPLSLTAKVYAQSLSYDVPTGSVTFMDGNTPIGTVSLGGTSTSMSATLTLPTGLAPGPHLITAVYGGDPNTAGSTSAVLSRTVTQLSTRTTLATSANPVLVGQSVTLTATVAGSTTSIKPTGAVDFYDGDAKLGTATLTSAGTAQWTTAFTAAGSHSLKAVYRGDTPDLGSTSAALTEFVAAANTTPTTPKVYLSSSLNPATLGAAVTFSVYVSPNGASIAGVGGTVTFSDGDKLIGTATLVNAHASLTVSTLAIGAHTITASYGGNALFNPASASLTETIKAPALGTVVGTGTTLAGQDSLIVDVKSALVNGAPAYSGALTFADKAAGDTFTAVSITSVQINEATPVAGASATNGYFVVTGTATLNHGTALYTFKATGSLPFPANTGSTGGLEFAATGPNGFSYSASGRSWDPGETIVMTVSA